MTVHSLDSLTRDLIYASSDLQWSATCSCSNPDGLGVGLVEFNAATAVDAVNLWAEHVASHPDALPVDGRQLAVTEVSHGGEDAIVTIGRDILDGILYLSIEVPDERFAQVRLTESEWDTLRGAR